MYQALYRKYRPQTFDEVVGQSVITSTLRNQVLTGKTSHAYLFTGTHGTGKTSCAKILAKAVNCLNPENGNPCNCCAACRAIDNGTAIDVQEIDAASNNGIENVRQLRDEAIFPPAELNKRVYIIDEVHMLSTAAFNALLKIIEEPPDYLLFILATTELSKVPVTIRSRCQRYAFRRLSVEDIAGRVGYVAYQEGIPLEDGVAVLLAKQAGGALRDGLSILDQCASTVSGQLTLENAVETLGIAGQQKSLEIMQAVGRQDAADAMHIFEEQYTAGKSIPALTEELAAITRDLVLLKIEPKVSESEISSTCSLAELAELEPMFTREQLLRAIELLQNAVNGFRNSVNQKMDAELCLLLLCTPQMQVDEESIAARLSVLEQSVQGRLNDLEARIAEGVTVPNKNAGRKTEESPEVLDPIRQTAAEKSEAAAPEAGQRDWDEIRSYLKEHVDGFGQKLIDDKLHGKVEEDRITIGWESDSFTDGMMEKMNIREAVQKAAEAVLGKQMTVQIRKGRDAEGDPFQDLASRIRLDQIPNIQVR